MRYSIMYKKLFSLLLSGALLAGANHAFAADERLFREDFNGAKGSSLSSNKWATETHKQGRGEFTSKGWVNGKGQIAMGVRTYNSRTPGLFSQSLIKTRQSFGPTRNKNIRIRWRAKINHNQVGIVHGAFLYRQYTQDGVAKSDELDFEWLTNHTANKRSDDLLVSTWYEWDREAQEYEQDATVYGTHFSREANFSGDTNSWRTYEMLWSRSSVIYRVDGREVYRFSDSDNVPKSRMPVFINAWVSDSSWAEAYNSNLQATRSKSQNKSYSMLVDWVEIHEVDK